MLGTTKDHFTTKNIKKNKKNKKCQNETFRRFNEEFLFTSERICRLSVLFVFYKKSIRVTILLEGVNIFFLFVF